MKKSKTMDNVKLFLLALPFMWLLQNTIHELSHLVAAKRVHGRKPLGLWPYPHFRQGKFYFARSAWSGGRIDGIMDPVWDAPFRWAFIQTIVLALSLVIFSGPAWFIMLRCASTACACIDMLWWLWCAKHGSRSCDAKRYFLGDF